MTGRYGNLDYPHLTKTGMAFGAALFVIGVLGEVALPMAVGPLPAWEETIFFDLEALGVLVLLFVPLIFGIALPLTE